MDNDFNQAITQHLGVQGVAVLRVFPNSGAADAGLRAAQRDRRGDIVVGDIVTEIDGKPVTSPSTILSFLDEHEVGEQVRLTILREGKSLTVTVKLQGEQTGSRI
jgi:S1-C subfamily serine protease